MRTLTSVEELAPTMDELKVLQMNPYNLPLSKPLSQAVEPTLSQSQIKTAAKQITPLQLVNQVRHNDVLWGEKSGEGGESTSFWGARHIVAAPISCLECDGEKSRGRSNLNFYYYR